MVRKSMPSGYDPMGGWAGFPKDHAQSKTQSGPKQRRRPKAPAANSRSYEAALRARVQHRDRAAVLRPARNVVADRDRALLAVGDGTHPARIDAARGHEGADRLGAACAECDVVLAGAALVRMTFDGEGVARIGLQPLHLFLQGCDRLRAQIGLVALEKHAVADIDHEILLASRGRGARHRVSAKVLVGTSTHRQRDRQYGGQLQSLEDAHLIFHSGASTLTFFHCYPVYRGLVKRTFRQP